MFGYIPNIVSFFDFEGLIWHLPEIYLRFEGLIWPLREVYSRFEGLMAEYSRSKIGGMALTRMGFYMRSSCRPAP